MTSTHPSRRLDWKSALLKAGLIAEQVHSPFWFGGSKTLSNQLNTLVLSGQKTATASLLWEWESEGLTPSKAGDIHLLLDWSNEVLGTLTNVAVSIVPFCEVTTVFAALEGEGDLSLEYWQKAHWKYFENVCHDIERTPNHHMPVVCQEFRFDPIQS